MLLRAPVRIFVRENRMEYLWVYVRVERKENMMGNRTVDEKVDL